MRVKVDWAQVEKLAVAGVSIEHICESFRVKEGTVRSRMTREKWPVATRAERLAAKMADRESVTQTMAQTILQKGELGSMKGLELVLGLLQSASVETLKPLEDVSDVNTAITAVRKAAGMDKAQEQNVNLNLALFGQSQDRGWSHAD